MKIHVSEKATRTVLLTVLAGIGAGFLNGLLGAGGGIVLVLALGALLPPGTEGGTVQDRFASAVTVMFPVSLLSCLLYWRGGSVDTALLPRLLLPAAAGGAVGACLMDRIKPDFLRKLFALLVIAAGVHMLL